MWSIENDRNSPSIRTIGRLAEALKVSPAELMGPPPDIALSAYASPNIPTLNSIPEEMVAILRSGGKTQNISIETFNRIVKIARLTFETESAKGVDAQTSLPLITPFSMTESGASQLAHILRAHLDIGSAIIYDVSLLFSIHGVRILRDPKLDMDAITLYSKSYKSFAIILSDKLSKTPEHRDFVIMTEIGRMFIFASHKFNPYRDSARSRRFAHHFAATFLQPASAIKTAVFSLRIQPNDWTYELLLRLKSRLGVSAQAFNIRLKELGLISMARYNEFDRLIKDHYAHNAKKEPQPKKNSCNSDRMGDIMELRDRQSRKQTSSFGVPR